MKLAVISDVHFGNASSALAAMTSSGVPRLGRAFEPFAAAAGTDNDYLVLLGDTFDFSVSDYATAYLVASTFFCEVNRRAVAKEILYIPGNHDFSFWNIALHEINVINQIKAKQLPKMRWTIPAVLDARAAGSTSSPLTLVGVGQEPPPSSRRNGKYGGLFFDQFTAPIDGSLPPMTVNVAYPNAYVCTSSTSTLLTHGHYFESYWSMTLPIVQRIFGQDFVLKSGHVDLETLVAVNFPLNELASAGVGQAGPLTDIVRQVVSDFRTSNLERAQQYINAAGEYLDHEVFVYGVCGLFKELLTDALIGASKAALLEALKREANVPRARHNRSFLHEAPVRRNIDRYLRASSAELAQIRRGGLDVPDVDSVIFGHTHHSIPTSMPIEHQLPDTQRSISICNTGGWLESTPGGPIDAAVFVFDSESSPHWSSYSIE